jgi:hypothetical protein
LSKLVLGVKVPREYVFSVVAELFRKIEEQVNRLAEGRIDARHEARTAVPTTGTWARGDVIDNSQPSELGTAGSMYVILGWVCVTAGTPGTWVERRALTGN